MTSACGRYVIVFNGEIYNFTELREQLEGAGHRFRGRSDTEVLLAAFTPWGVGATMPQLNGMFAFAVWDRRERLLHLVEVASDQPAGDAYVYALTDEAAYLQTDDDDKPAVIPEPPPDPAQFKCWFCRKSHQQVHTLSGEGELLVSQLAFEEVGEDVPVTAGPHRPRQPQNLDFSQT